MYDCSVEDTAVSHALLSPHVPDHVSLELAEAGTKAGRSAVSVTLVDGERRVSTVVAPDLLLEYQDWLPKALVEDEVRKLSEVRLSDWCRLCGRDVRWTGERWVHANGRVYRHYIDRVEAG